MPSITEQSAWAEASHIILLISGSDYFLIKAEFMKKTHSHSDPDSYKKESDKILRQRHLFHVGLSSPVIDSC